MTERLVPLPNRRATKILARALAAALGPGDLYVLSGPLGAGKTFLVRAVCRALGLSHEIPVVSPTFTLMHEYDTVPPLVHADLYRLGTPDEGPVDDSTLLALSEQRTEGRVLFVEWGAPFVEALGGDAVTVMLDVSPRSARLGSTGARSSARVGALRL